jgi:RNA polymerase sigma-70 factor (ECF subfamily)
MTTEHGRDLGWFERLFRETQQPLRRYAVRRLPLDDVDDLVAEVYATAWQRREITPEPELPWLYRTAAHHLAHTRRSDRRRTRLAARLASAGEPEITPAVDVAEVDPAVAAVLAALPAADAEILRLAAWEELSPTEIAYVQGVRRGRRVRLHRARRRAAALLADHDAATPGERTLSATAHVRPTPVPTEEFSC